MLRGDLPRPAFPDALRAAAPPRWWGDAQATLAYGRGAYAARGRLAETAGTVATAACQAAHAVLAATGQWVTNEKTLLDRAGLRGVDEVLASLTPDADHLTKAVDAAEAQLRAAVVRATTSGSVPGSRFHDLSRAALPSPGRTPYQGPPAVEPVGKWLLSQPFPDRLRRAGRQGTGNAPPGALIEPTGRAAGRYHAGAR